MKYFPGVKKNLVQLFIIVLMVTGLPGCGQEVPQMVSSTQEHESQTGNKDNTNDQEEDAVNTKKYTQGKTKKSQNMPEIEINGPQVKVSVQNEVAYRKFLGLLDEFENCDSLSLRLSGADISVCLDDILAGHNLKYLSITRGTITAGNAEALDGISLNSLVIYGAAKVEKGVLEPLLLRSATIILNDQYTGELSMVEALNSVNCEELVIAWEGDKSKGLFHNNESDNRNLKEWDDIYSILLETGGVLESIYRHNGENFSYTCYTFHKKNSEELCAEMISVKDWESGGKKYFDILNIPEDRIEEIPKGTYISRYHKMWMHDINFDGYDDIILRNCDGVYSFYRDYVTFLWNPDEEKYEYCETAPRNFEECVTVEEHKAYYFYPDANAGPSIYYIYEYADGAFVRHSLEIEHRGDRRIYVYCKEGELIREKELFYQKEDHTWHVVREENGTIVEESMAEDLTDIECAYFPEFTYIWQNRIR